jgi:hypothetical protein
MKRIGSILFPISLLILLTFCSSWAQAQDVTFTAKYYGKIVKVDIASGWSDTGIDVVAGNNYSIIVKGVASTDGATVPSDAYWYGPAGGREPAGSTYPLPGVPVQSTIGKIGTSGTPFYVGTLFTFTVNKSGRLYLGFNDTLFSDNAGYYIAFVHGPGLGL